MGSRVDDLRNRLAHGQGFFNDVAFGVVQTVSDLVPETQYTTPTDHVKMFAESAGETLAAVGSGVKHSLWDKKNEFVQGVVRASHAKDPLSQVVTATMATGSYYVYALTAGAAVNAVKSVYRGCAAIADSDSTEQALAGVAAVYGGVGAAAGLAAGASNLISSPASSAVLTVLVQNGEQLAFAAVGVPVAEAGGVAAAGIAANGVASLSEPLANQNRPMRRSGEPALKGREAKRGRDDEFDRLAKEWGLDPRRKRMVHDRIEKTKTGGADNLPKDDLSAEFEAMFGPPKKTIGEAPAATGADKGMPYSLADDQGDLGPVNSYQFGP